MKKVRKFILLSIITLSSSIAFGLDVSGPTSATHGLTPFISYTYTSDPFGQLDLPPDFTNYTFDWLSWTGTQYNDWYTLSETCASSGASGTFGFVTPSSSYGSGYARIAIVFQTSWNIFTGYLDVTVQ